LIILTSTVEDEIKKSNLAEVFNRMSKEFNRVEFKETPESILEDYNKKVGNRIKELNKYLNHETHEGVKLEDVTKYVETSGKLLEQEIANIQKDAETKFTDKEQINNYIATETKSFASQLLDKILNEFKGIKIDGQDVRDILRGNEVFNRIASEAAKVSSTPITN
jgi:hypothetical protein